MDKRFIFHYLESVDDIVVLKKTFTSILYWRRLLRNTKVYSVAALITSKNENRSHWPLYFVKGNKKIKNSSNLQVMKRSLWYHVRQRNKRKFHKNKFNRIHFLHNNIFNKKKISKPWNVMVSSFSVYKILEEILPQLD